MAEVAAIPDCGLRLVSTFTGAGGSCLGFRMAGYRTLWASEFVEAARDTYAANFPDVPVDERDIRDVTARQVLRRAGVKKGELDVLEGSPPCASFSMAGKRQRHWGEVRPYSETSQRTDDLFWEFGRLLDGVKPRCFVAENVPGMARGVAKGYFLEILAHLQRCGYRVEARILDAQWLGVPQRRQRLFFVGVRDDLGVDPGPTGTASGTRYRGSSAPSTARSGGRRTTPRRRCRHSGRGTRSRRR
jgi:DNA (cytosine-5)-methyltransferase 1